MDEQNYQGMMDGVSDVLGPFFTKIVKGNTEIDVPAPARLVGPLLGYGDLIEIGFWVRVERHSIDPAMPLQVLHYTLDRSHPAISLLNRVQNVQFCYAEPGTMKPWSRFTVVPLDDVPLYLREALPRNQEEIDTWRLLSKEQLLTQYAGVAEVVCYVVLFTVPYKRAGKTRPQYVRRDLIPLRFSWKAAKRQLKLEKIAEVWPCNGNPYGGVGERAILDNGWILSQSCYGYALFDPQGEGQTLKQFMRHLVKQPWQVIE